MATATGQELTWIVNSEMLSYIYSQAYRDILVMLLENASKSSETKDSLTTPTTTKDSPTPTEASLSRKRKIRDVSDPQPRRCRGLTNRGIACKRVIRDECLFCHLHDD